VIKEGFLSVNIDYPRLKIFLEKIMTGNINFPPLSLIFFVQ
jgi:hypothetical protein